MPLSVAEYLGQRTDYQSQDIIPSSLGGREVPTCPFSGVACRKLKSRSPSHPVCSVRTQDGKPFIVCPDRLIPSYANALSPSHIAALAEVSRVVFPNADTTHIGYKRQVSIAFAPKRRLVLDYVLQIAPEANYITGRKKVILEVQGGGETSSTGGITEHITQWAKQQNPTNEFLRKPISSEYMRELLNIPANKSASSPGIIPNNAWKRQLDQVLKKAVLTKHFGGAFALVMGEVLYDYVKNTLSAGRDYFSEWQIALLGITETESTEAESILFRKVSKAVFMTYDEFIEALQNFSLSETIKDPFTGEFTTLRNRKFRI